MLDTASLKQARLVSRIWSQHASIRLFSEVYVIFAQASLCKLLWTAEHFGPLVRKVVIQAYMYGRADECGRCSLNYTKSRSLRTGQVSIWYIDPPEHARSFHLQDTIIRRQFHTEILKRAFTCLSKLDTLELVDCHSDRTIRSIQGGPFVPPEVSLRHGFLHSTEPIGFRPLKTCLSSLANGTPLRRLLCYDQDVAILRSPEILRSWLHCLQDFSIELIGDDDALLRQGELAQLLQSAKGLRHLRISIWVRERSNGLFDLPSLVGGNTWASLPHT